MMKKLLCLLLVLVTALSASLTAAAQIAEDGTENLTQEEETFPRITNIYPAQDGVTISFTAYPGASKYRIFIRKTDGTGWRSIADTAELTYTRTGITAYTTDTYTVRAIGADGRYLSDYDKTGYTYTYLPAPQLMSVVVVNGGVKLTWNPVKGAPCYRVFVKNGSGWKGIVTTDATSYIDRGVTSGSSYTYTVRVLDVDRKTSLSYYLRTGITAQYVAAPQITSCIPVEDGVLVSWGKVAGAAKYRLFVRGTLGWTAVGTTDGASLTHTGIASGSDCTYTVRALGADGKYVSSYDAVGTTCRYVSAPELTGIVKTAQGVTLSWSRVTGAAGYRVYRRTFGNAWTAVADTVAPSYRDRGCPKNALCSYAICAIGADRQPVSGCRQDVPYYYNGALANGAIPFRGTTLNFKDGNLRQGYVTLNGKTYYYDENGVLMKDGIVGSEQEGWRYADKDGVIDMSYTGIVQINGVYRYFKDGLMDTVSRIAVTYGGSDWNVLSGTAYRVTTEKDKTLHRALKLVAQLTTPSMTKEQKLRACFNYLQTETYESNPRVPHYRGMDWPVVYANDIFLKGGGNCFSYAAAFGFMAKAIGYTDVYGCHSGGHGWTEIGGLVYDAEWQRSHHRYSYYGLSYYTGTDVAYLSVKQNFPYNAWMHVEI